MSVGVLSFKRPQNIRLPQGALSVLHNAALIVAGCIIFIIGMSSVMIPAGLFSGGLLGVAILAQYHMPALDLGLVYFFLNIPLFILGWMAINRRFMLYSIFGLTFFSLAASYIEMPSMGVEDPILAALLSGVICGVGCGLILRSVGSAGGLDILAVVLNRRYGLRIGTIVFTANSAVILLGAYLHDVDMALYSLIFFFTCGRLTDQVISGFSARKSVMVVSDRWEEISRSIMGRNGNGVTYLDGEGAYSGKKKKVIMTVTTPTDLPRLRESILAIDPDAFLVINDTQEVIRKKCP